MRWIWIIIFLGQAAAAGAWWWLMPGGFPADELRFWINQVLPWFVIGTALAGIAAALRRSTVLAQFALVPALTLTLAGMLCRYLYPISSYGRWWKLLGAGAVMFVLIWLTRRSKQLKRALPEHAVAALGWAVIAGVSSGVLLPLAQRAPDPSTRPLNPVMELSGTLPMPHKADEEPKNTIALSGSFSVNTPREEVLIQTGNLQITVQPLLTFVSRSLDRCWTSLNHRLLRDERPREQTLLLNDKSRVTVFYENMDGEATLVCAAEADGGAAIDARTTIESEVFSHLNSFCAIQISGQAESLALEFNACPGVRIDVLPADYPFGRPARFAYIDAAKLLHVAEASSGEKGPFKELTSGALRDGQPLTITIYEGNEAKGRIEFDDFAAQCSFALSPTAGWRVPVNAIEFQRDGDAPGSPVSIFMTLAATSVGRGWDSVGHSIGTYRNRMRVVPLK